MGSRSSKCSTCLHDHSDHEGAQGRCLHYNINKFETLVCPKCNHSAHTIDWKTGTCASRLVTGSAKEFETFLNLYVTARVCNCGHSCHEIRNDAKLRCELYEYCKKCTCIKCV